MRLFEQFQLYLLVDLCDARCKLTCLSEATGIEKALGYHLQLGHHHRDRSKVLFEIVGQVLVALTLRV